MQIQDHVPENPSFTQKSAAQQETSGCQHERMLNPDRFVVHSAEAGVLTMEICFNILIIFCQ